MDLYAFFQSEVKPTIGCTEPGAVAYAAAVAARHLPTQPEGIRLEMSVAIYKNGRSVGIPGTNGLRGLTLACVLGALGGNPDKGLMALEDIPADTVEQAQAFIDAGKMAEEVVQGTPSMWARVTLSGGGHTVSCTVARKHDHVERLVADGAVLVDQPLEAQSGGTDWTDELTAMHFEELWNLALGIDDAIVRQMLEGARMNMAILDHAGTEQAGIGSALAKHNGHGSLSDKIKEVAGAASDLRMSGGDVAVMSSAGSGNHGIVAVIPVAMTARELGADDRKLAEALALSHLVCGYIKAYTGRLTPTCGCASRSGGGHRPAARRNPASGGACRHHPCGDAPRHDLRRSQGVLRAQGEQRRQRGMVSRHAGPRKPGHPQHAGHHQPGYPRAWHHPAGIQREDFQRRGFRHDRIDDPPEQECGKPRLIPAPRKPGRLQPGIPQGCGSETIRGLLRAQGAGGGERFSASRE